MVGCALLSNSTIALLKGEFDVKKKASTTVDHVTVRLGVIRIPGELNSAKENDGL